MNWLASPTSGSYPSVVRTVGGTFGTSPEESSPEAETMDSSDDGREDEYANGMSVKKGVVKSRVSEVSPTVGPLVLS